MAGLTKKRQLLCFWISQEVSRQD